MPDTFDIPKTYDTHKPEISTFVEDKTTPKKWIISGRCWILFCIIFTVGFSVRLMHISTESVWWDEFATVAFLTPPQSYVDSPDYDRWNQQVIRHSSPTLKEFLAQNRLVDPAAMPLYLSMEFYWNRYIARSAVSLRLMSLIISIQCERRTHRHAGRCFVADTCSVRKRNPHVRAYDPARCGTCIRFLSVVPVWRQALVDTLCYHSATSVLDASLCFAASYCAGGVLVDFFAERPQADYCLEYVERLRIVARCHLCTFHPILG